jgi:hypothetical protein
MIIGDVCSYIHVHILSEQSLSKEIRRAEHKYMNIPPPPNYRSSYGSGVEIFLEINLSLLEID